MIRPAQKEDASAVIPLLFLAMQDIAMKLAGTKDLAVVQTLFEYFFQQEVNQYSYKNTLVYEDEDGIGGMILSYDGGDLDQLRDPVLDHLQNGFIPERETGPGEYYLDSIAVSANSQGKGIGKQLIAAAIEKAKEEGHSNVGLLVHEDNADALRLYERLGFKAVDMREFAGGHYKHMVKRL
jgi:ribosomal protein S18 acetylase RimI-like enzyme